MYAKQLNHFDDIENALIIEKNNDDFFKLPPKGMKWRIKGYNIIYIKRFTIKKQKLVK